MKIVLKGKVPSKKNSKRLIMRGGSRFLVPSEAHEAWHEEQMWALKRCKKALSAQVKVVMTIFPPDRRAGDLSNKFESIADLLVDAGIITDDNWFIMPHTEHIFGGVDKENPRAEIEILELSPAA